MEYSFLKFWLIRLFWFGSVLNRNIKIHLSCHSVQPKIKPNYFEIEPNYLFGFGPVWFSFSSYTLLCFIFFSFCNFLKIFWTFTILYWTFTPNIYLIFFLIDWFVAMFWYGFKEFCMFLSYPVMMVHNFWKRDIQHDLKCFILINF